MYLYSFTNTTIFLKNLEIAPESNGESSPEEAAGPWGDNHPGWHVVSLQKQSGRGQETGADYDPFEKEGEQRSRQMLQVSTVFERG